MDPEATVPKYLIEGLDKGDALELESDLAVHVYWEGDAGNSDSESEEECEFTEAGDNMEFDENEFQEVVKMKIGNAFQKMIASSHEKNAFSHHFRYQQGVQPTQRHKQREAKKENDRILAAAKSNPLDKGFLIGTVSKRHCPSKEETWRQEHRMALEDIEKKLQSKKICLGGQNLNRHRAVLAFLRMQESKKLGDTREEMSYMVARCFGKGIYFARKLVSWEIT